MTNNFPDFRNPQVAFQNALGQKALYEKKLPFRLYYYVGDWMYMHSDKSKNIDYFKNKNTRKYIEVFYEK